MTVGGAAQLARPTAASARRRTRVVAAATAVVTAMAVAVVAWMVTGSAGAVQFAVVEQPGGDALYARSIEVGETFTLEHTHSVTKRLVVETFSVADEETIAMEELWFDQFGPNLPAGPEQLGDHVSFIYEDGGGIRVLHHGFPLGSVPLRVGNPDVDHLLTFADGERVRLLDIARSGAWVDFIVDQR